MHSYCNRTTRLTAAIIAVAYILVQCFQEYVIRQMPEPGFLSGELLQGRSSLNLWRSMLLLLSFFLLLYLFLVVCLEGFSMGPVRSIMAFIFFFIFCVLEISIRSVEFFYVQVQLPEKLLQSKDALIKQLVMDQYHFFLSVQAALYFPLMLSQALASVIIVFLYQAKQRANYLVTVAFALNAIRLAGRLAGMTLGVNWFNGLGDILYLPFVITIFGLISVWLIIYKDNSTRMRDC